MPPHVALVVLLYVFMSAVTFVVYGVDKRAAIRGRSRVPESTLHMLELLCGFPGALVGQQVFRHKRRKLRFVAISWLIAVAHAAGWGFWLLAGRT